MRQTSFQRIDIPLSREIETKYDDIKLVADNIADLVIIASNISNGTIARVLEVLDEPLKSNILALGPVADEIVTVAGISADVVAVADNQADISSVAAKLADIGIVADNMADINTVVANMTDIQAVAADIGHVVTVGTDLADANSAVKDVSTNMTTVSTVAASILGINTVAADIANVNTVAADIAAIKDVAANETNVNAVAGSIANVNAVGNDIANVNLTANSIADVNTYAKTYQGAKASAPITRNDGSTLLTGDMYFDTTLDMMMAYNGSVWQSVGSTVNGTSRRQSFTATAGQTVFPITGGYDAGYADVHMNGRKLVNGKHVDVSSGTDIVLARPATAGDTIDVVAYGTFVLADHYTKAESDSGTQTLTNKTINDASNSVGANHIHYKVKAAENLIKGDVVKVVGYNQGQDATEVAKTSAVGDVAFGIVEEDIDSGAFGTVIQNGTIDGLDTSMFTTGDILYSDGAGWLTATKPTTGYYQALALVLKSNANVGALYFIAREPVNLEQVHDFSKPNDGVLFEKLNPTSFKIPAGLKVKVNGIVQVLESDYTVTLSSPVAGTDYKVYAKVDGSFYADTTPANSTDRLIGGFHYGLVDTSEAPTGNKTEADMVAIRGINKYSFWDLKFRPFCSPDGMVYVNGKWYDIYLLNSEHIANGTSKAGATIAGGVVDANARAIPKIPLEYGGDGAVNYGKFTWFQACEIAKAHSKELISYAEFPTIAFGVVEGVDSSTRETNIGKIEHYPDLTSKYGIEQATGTQYIWGKDVGGNRDEGSTSWGWRDKADGRGQIYALNDKYITAVILGGIRGAGSYAGSRASHWNNYVWNSTWHIGCRLACDHLEMI